MSRRCGVVDRRAVAHLEQHELDTAERLAILGLDVVFRLPAGKNTVDASVNGVGAEFKSPLSPHRNTVMRRITAKRHTQGPRFVLDMSRSSMTFEEAWSIAATLASRYGEDGVVSILVIKQMSDGDVLSGIVGEEVTEWRT